MTAQHETHPTGAATPARPSTLTAAEKEEMVRSTRRFDLRRMIGGLFVLYGVILTVMGISPSSADLARTDGLNINLWTGLGMLLTGILFFVWDRMAPVPAEDIIMNAENQAQLVEEGKGNITMEAVR